MSTPGFVVEGDAALPDVGKDEVGSTVCVAVSAFGNAGVGVTAC